MNQREHEPPLPEQTDIPAEHRVDTSQVPAAARELFSKERKSKRRKKKKRIGGTTSRQKQRKIDLIELKRKTFFVMPKAPKQGG
jgi:hypothetical protein